MTLRNPVFNKTSSHILGGLLASTILLAAPAAMADDNDLEARVNRLETLLETVLERLDEQRPTTPAAPATTTTRALSAQELEQARQALERERAEIYTLREELAKDRKAAEAERIQQREELAKDRRAAQAERIQQREEMAELKERTSEESVLEIANNVYAQRERATGFSIGDTKFSFGGYVKVDTIVSKFSDGELPSSSIARDFYIPGATPISAGLEEPQVELDFNARETRFLFQARTPVGEHELFGHIELDFQVTDFGNEVVSNSFTPRVRQAFLKYRNFTVGQVWSTFQDVSALPENLDFIGPAEGTVFVRQPLVRFTQGPWEVAFEEPELLVTAPGDIGSGIANDDILPDFVVRYTHQIDRATLKAAVLLRHLRVEGGDFTGLDERDSAVGYGLSLSGKIQLFERDDFRFMFTAGDGLGRYIGVALVDGVAITDGNDLDAIATYSGFGSYRHFWSDKWRSNFTFGYFLADNPTEFTGDTVNNEVLSVHANILYSPVPKLTVGLEYIFSRRELENSLSGTLNRWMFSAKYGF
ncbi:MAG: DcaP family trimeric outer membrane transporter [Pseudomonadota bacterium]